MQRNTQTIENAHASKLSDITTVFGNRNLLYIYHVFHKAWALAPPSLENYCELLELPVKCEQVNKCFWRISQLSQSGCCPRPNLFDLCHRYQTQYKQKYTKNKWRWCGQIFNTSSFSCFEWRMLAKGNILFYLCFFWNGVVNDHF